MIPVADDAEPRTQPSLHNSPPDRKEVILREISLRPSLCCLVPSLPSFRSLTSDSPWVACQNHLRFFFKLCSPGCTPSCQPCWGRGGGAGPVFRTTAGDPCNPAAEPGATHLSHATVSVSPRKASPNGGPGERTSNILLLLNSPSVTTMSPTRLQSLVN